MKERDSSGGKVTVLHCFKDQGGRFYLQQVCGVALAVRKLADGECPAAGEARHMRCQIRTQCFLCVGITTRNGVVNALR